MKKISLLLVMTIVIQLFMHSNALALDPSEDMRAVWISTVHNLDFPSVKNNPDKQKEEYIAFLDELEEIGINTVIVQVRPKGDALYASQINPWSDVLTGEQGKYPGYDPLAFMIEETHKRGMAFHAWLNPYRVTTSGTQLEALSPLHPARQNPSWVISHNNALYYNPELEEVKQHIEDTVAEIVRYYDVDGVHFDDYFYPADYPLPEGETRDGEVANARRSHVNEMIERVGIQVKKIDPNVQFGVSPSGIWKNQKSDPSGSKTGGSESYYKVYADTRTWIQNEWIDYVVPQIYWEIGHSSADYSTLVEWWSQEVKGTNVKLYIGQGIYKENVAMQMSSQLSLNKQYPQVKGSIYFSLRDLLKNKGGCKEQISRFYGKVIEEDVAPVRPGMIQLVINGEVIQCEVAPFIAAGTTLVPLRVISENLNASVNWYGETKEITIRQGNSRVELKIGETLVYKGEEAMNLSTPPQIVHGTTMVPIRFISESLGAQVEWLPDQQRVQINSK